MKSTATEPHAANGALLGQIELALRYGAAGRPEHLYRWVGTAAS
jgi:response regulator of citrate/malate metabolism